MKLLVKGPLSISLSTAQSRGIPILTAKNIGKESLLETPTLTTAQYLIVGDWFAENPPIVEGIGYPAGTLLHYSGR